jgi:hypothetical protein
MLGATKNTYEPTRRRLLTLYQSNSKYMPVRDWFISRALLFPFPYNTIYARKLKRSLNILYRFHLASYCLLILISSQF